jgi:C4-dicarboxylate transporter, DctQ subunit
MTVLNEDQVLNEGFIEGRRIFMKKVLDKIESAVFHIDSGFEKVTRFFWYIGGFFIVLMAFVVAYGAIARYVFRSPVALTYDITCILMLSCVALCIPYTQKLGRHLRLDLFDNIFPKAVTEIIVKIVGPLLGLLFIGVLTWKCWENSFFALKIAETTKSSHPIPTFPLKIMFTFFAGLLCLVFILQILRYPFDVRKRRSEKIKAESAQEEE